MPDKPKRRRPNILITLDPKTVATAKRVGLRQRPPITAFSRIVEAALVEWSDHHKRPAPHANE